MNARILALPILLAACGGSNTEEVDSPQPAIVSEIVGVWTQTGCTTTDGEETACSFDNPRKIEVQSDGSGWLWLANDERNEQDDCARFGTGELCIGFFGGDKDSCFPLRTYQGRLLYCAGGIGCEALDRDP